MVASRFGVGRRYRRLWQRGCVGAALLGVLPLVACGSDRVEPPPTVPPPPPCPLVAADGWNAVIAPGARPGVGRLTVAGRLTMPSAGWRHTWSHFAQIGTSPPSAIVDLVIFPQEGASDPIVQEVRGEWPASPTVAAVTVRCGGDVVAQLRPVPVDRAR